MTQVYVSNFPLIWPLLRQVLPILRRLTPGEGSTTVQRNTTGYSGHPLSRLGGTRNGARRLEGNDSDKIGRTESEERIAHPDETYWGKSGGDANGLTKDGITTNVTFTLTEEESDETDSKRIVHDWNRRGNAVRTDIEADGHHDV
jgi:hypothetical protein